MSISLASQDTITVVENGGNPTGEPYIRLRLDNGYECFLHTYLGQDAIQEEAQRILDSFNSQNPPTNWFPYNGYIAS